MNCAKLFYDICDHTKFCTKNICILEAHIAKFLQEQIIFKEYILKHTSLSPETILERIETK